MYDLEKDLESWMRASHNVLLANPNKITSKLQKREDLINLVN